MEELFRVEGEVLWIMVPKELDHHSCIEIRENADIQAFRCVVLLGWNGGQG